MGNKIVRTYGELMDKYDWDKVCDVLGLNPWFINEGLGETDDLAYLTVEQAEEIGVL